MTVKTRIFNSRRHKVLRKHIPVIENLVTLALLGVLVGIVFWVIVQKNHYNPEDRDIATELLSETTSPALYIPPLRPWIEPGTPPSSATPDLGLFPDAILDQEWQLSSRVKQFNSDNLYEKINGEAEKFLKQGFMALHYAVLKSRDDGSEIAIELYDQGDMKGSMGIFSDHLSEDKNIEQIDTLVYFRTSVGIIGRQDRFFFRVAGDRETEKIQQKSAQLIEVFTKLEKDESKTSEEFRILNMGLAIPQELISFESRNVFQFDFVSNFWFGRFAQEAQARIFVHRAPSSEIAMQLFGNILEEQRYEYETVEQSDHHVILWHEFLRNYFAMGLYKQFIFGIENVSDLDQTASILKKFTEALAGG